MRIRIAVSRLLTLFAMMFFSLNSIAACQNTGLQMQVLGSGGPGAASGRASSAYLLWLDGRSRILIDAGGGTKNLFHQSGADLNDLDLIAMSHFHPDHSAELPAILWPTGGEFTFSGPVGGGVFPGAEDFARQLMGSGGVFEILNSRVELEVVEAPLRTNSQVSVWSSDGLQVTGTGVPHGDVPTIAYRIDYGESSIAFTSDQNGSDSTFINFIRDVDYLVIHLAGDEDSTGLIARLHAKPSVWGQMAASAGAGHVIVSHISTSDPAQLQTNLDILSSNFSGPVTVSEDLMCFELD